MVFPGEKEEARQEETDIQLGNANVKQSASFTAKQNDGTVKENIVPEQRGFEKHEQGKIIRQLESLGIDKKPSPRYSIPIVPVHDLAI